MTSKRANAIYDVLVQECGAREDERPSFLFHQTAGQVSEWRFCGKLGFGGKFWRSGGSLFTKELIYVDCYSENMTPERRAMIEKANKILAAL